MKNREQHYYRILTQIEAGQAVTQRALSNDLGIALGLTNLLIKKLVRKGYIKTRAAIDGKRVRYLLTPSGLAERARLSLLYLENSIQLYAEARDRIRHSLNRIRDSANGARPRIVFYGAGEITEIAYVVLNHSSFELVGIVDDAKEDQMFLGHRVAGTRRLRDTAEDGAYDHIIVTSFANQSRIEARLEELSVPARKVCFL